MKAVDATGAVSPHKPGTSLASASLGRVDAARLAVQSISSHRALKVHGPIDTGADKGTTLHRKAHAARAEA